MGTFRVSMTVTNPNTGTSDTVNAVVDTGATLTTLPPSLARELGLEQEDTATVRLADGSLRELALSTARLAVQNRTRTTPVLISETEDTPALLGAVTLEAMGLAVDPIGERLVPQELLLL